MISVKIKSANMTNDVNIDISSNETVGGLRERVLDELNCQGKHVRLISSGKMLQPDRALLCQCGVKDGTFIHAVITNAPGRSSLPVPENNSSDSSNRNGQPTSRNRGFDTLINAGLTIDEAAALRSSFSSQVEEYMQQNPPRSAEDPVAYRYRMEEEWMAQQGPQSEFSLNLPRRSRISASIPSLVQLPTLASSAEDSLSSGTFREFLWGMMLGSALGFLMLFCVWDRNISHKQKMGILCGVCLHMFSGLLQQRQMAAHSDANPVSSSSYLRPLDSTSHTDVSLDAPEDMNSASLETSSN